MAMVTPRPIARVLHQLGRIAPALGLRRVPAFFSNAASPGSPAGARVHVRWPPGLAVGVGAGALLVSLMAVASATPHPAGQRPIALAALQVRADSLLAGLDPSTAVQERDVLVAPLANGRRAELTLDPALQRYLQKLFQRYDVPYGAVVALEPSSGRVRAYVSHSAANPMAGDLVRDPTPPAASVFKIVTGAALLDSGVGASARVCYNGGFRRLDAVDLRDNPGRDRSCATLSKAMGASINTVFAKLADRHLDPSTLARYADAFGFGQALPFDVATRPSPVEVPSDRLEFARTAAGFWHVHMSPLHAALISATVANQGVMPRAALVDRVLDADGKPLRALQPEAFRPVIPASTARKLTAMMERTVSEGTAHKAFFDNRDRPFLPGIRVAGKTGSLSANRPYRAYSWWVGFAPADNPQLAVAALVVNTPRWRIKGSYVAREALRYHLVEQRR
ncbi:MAG: penicillin-binding transpeptidase domain-containing protein [Myxococcales bacterium]|nr:penicillin-binding transpeptidase domain-containing protein [Myxococcales bacterium]